jgi:hypothetical protein
MAVVTSAKCQEQTFRAVLFAKSAESALGDYPR